MEKKNDSETFSNHEKVMEVALTQFHNYISTSQNWYLSNGASPHVIGFALNLTNTFQNERLGELC